MCSDDRGANLSGMERTDTMVITAPRQAPLKVDVNVKRQLSLGNCPF
jgi:hypothetical protein